MCRKSTARQCTRIVETPILCTFTGAANALVYLKSMFASMLLVLRRNKLLFLPPLSSSSSSSFYSSSSSASSLLMHQAMRTRIRTSIRTSTFYEYLPRLRNALSHRALALPHQRIQNERWRQIATWTMRQPTRWREHLLSRSRCRWHLQCMTIVRLSHVSMYKNI